MPDLRTPAFSAVKILSPDDYAIFKTALNAGRHPGFVGRDNYCRCAAGGGALLFFAEGKPVAVALMNCKKNALIALNVEPEFRGRGFGKMCLQYLKPNWVRAIESSIPFFESMGFQRVGALKVGRTLKTAIMVRGDLIGLAGRLENILRART